MANPIVQARVSPAIREEATRVLDQMGLDMSTAVRMFVTRVAQEKRLPFKLEPNAKTLAAMREADQGKVERFDSVEAMMERLNAGD